MTSNFLFDNMNPSSYHKYKTKLTSTIYHNEMLETYFIRHANKNFHVIGTLMETRL